MQRAARRSQQFMGHRSHPGEVIDVSNCACSKGPRVGLSSAQLKELIRARRARATYFGAHLFVDPAWDILLLAYVAALDQERLAVSTLLQTSLLPATTMLRWVEALEQEGWLNRTNRDLESPKSFLDLSVAGKLGMERYLAAVWPSLPL